MRTQEISAQEEGHLRMPDAMRIVAAERAALHERILRLRALREAAEAERALAPAPHCKAKA